MSNTPLETKILDLEARLKAENESRNMDKLPKDLGNVMGDSRQGMGRRPRQRKFPAVPVCLDCKLKRFYLA